MELNPERDDQPAKFIDDAEDKFILVVDNGFDDVTMTTTSVIDDGSTSRNISEYLQSYLGSRYRSLAESIALTVVYCLVFATGIIGNVCTGLIVWRRQYMRTSTNYYLCSLAISDVLTLIIGLPPELYSIWQSYPWVFGQTYCVLKTFLTEMASATSILTITAFTVERYVAICHPLVAKAISSPPRVIKTIVCLWLISGVTASPYAFYTRTYHYVMDPITGLALADSLICSVPADWFNDVRIIIQFSTFSLFVLPMSMITILYVFIGITVRRSISTTTTTTATATSTPSRVADTAVTVTSTGTRTSRTRTSIATRPLVSRMIQTGVRGSSTMAMNDTELTKNRCRTSTSSKVNTGIHTSPKRMTNQRKTVVEMLVAVVVAFFVCWAPFHAQRLMTAYIRDQWTPALLEIQSMLFYISGILYFVSCTVNPILYNLMSNRYRRAFRETLCCCRLHQTANRVIISFSRHTDNRSDPHHQRQRQQQQQQRCHRYPITVELGPIDGITDGLPTENDERCGGSSVTDDVATPSPPRWRTNSRTVANYDVTLADT